MTAGTGIRSYLALINTVPNWSDPVMVFLRASTSAYASLKEWVTGKDSTWGWIAEGSIVFLFQYVVRLQCSSHSLEFGYPFPAAH